MRTISFVVSLVVVLLAQSPAFAEPWFGWGENAFEDRFADGDIDEADLLPSHSARLLAGANQMRGDTWFSVAAYTRELEDGRDDIGGVLILGLALDRMAAGDVRQVADSRRSLPSSPVRESTAPPHADASTTAPQRASAPSVAPSVARECVRAALRASGLDTSDERIDDLAAKARASAWLPETRMRIMRLLNTTLRTTTLTTTDGVNYYDAAGANLELELRLTWRLDRVLFSGDEPTLERVRLEREQARSRVGTRAIEALFAWQRAEADLDLAAAGSREQSEARLRVSESAALLDVITDGWFTERGPRGGATSE
jgi:hypothetical protein